MSINALNCETLSGLVKGRWLHLKVDGLARAEIEKMEDRQLIALTLSGNAKAYEAVVRRYQKLVYNVLYQMFHDHETAADVTQETFMKAFKALPTFRQESPFKPWLLRIATNSGLNVIRAAKSKYHDSLDSMLEENPLDEPSSGQNVEAEVEWRLSHAMLNEALMTLPARHRHIFLLRYQHDLSYADIATVMDEPETTIKSMLFRIREKLKKMLSEKMA
jgi:RNA polymerase sigma-70 factor, ECF subfamily